MKPTNVIIISASSDIGAALAKSWSENGWKVFGTYRRLSDDVTLMREKHQVIFVEMDLKDITSVEAACQQLKELCPSWDALVIAPGELEPIGRFADVDFDAWENGIQINLLRQLRIVHRLLPARNKKSAFKEPSVLFFAGGGTNNAPPYYTSYNLSKVALIKMCEFLDSEMPDTRFVIVGPGVVKTKIHKPTLRLGAKFSGDNYQKTVDRLKNNECTPMENVIDCCTWLITTSSVGVRGRNFSVASDKYATDLLEKKLESDPNMYKLRRHNNSWTANEV